MSHDLLSEHAFLSYFKVLVVISTRLVYFWSLISEETESEPVSPGGERWKVVYSPFKSTVYVALLISIGLIY